MIGYILGLLNQGSHRAFFNDKNGQAIAVAYTETDFLKFYNEVSYVNFEVLYINN